MKKYVFTFASIGMLALASCKKDRNCECKVSTPGSPVVTNVVPLENATRSDARDACNALELTYSIGGATADCSLK